MSTTDLKIIELARIKAYWEGKSYDSLTPEEQQKYIRLAEDQKERESKMTDDELYRARGI